MKKTIAASSLLYALPFVAFAQSGNLQGVLRIVQDLINLVIPLLIAAALIAFFWGLVKYIWSSGDEHAESSGRQIMIAGIVGLFLMVAIWGIIGILTNTFGVNRDQVIRPPKVQF